MKLHLKQISVIIIASLLVTLSPKAISQRPYKSISNPVNNSLFKAVTDTLMPLSFLSGTLTLDSALAGGYVCGTNAYNDVAKAQIFQIEDSLSYFVNGCALYVGDVQINDSNKYLTVNLYDLWGMGFNNGGQISSGAPGSILATVDIPMGILAENQLNYIYFSAENWVIGGYALGIDFTNCDTNQIGLISTSDGDAQQLEMAWEKLSNGLWYSMLSTWPFDGDLGIFSLINSVNAGFVNNKVALSSFDTYPNPVLNNNFSIECLLPVESTASMKFFNINGTLILEKEMFFHAGENIVSVSVPELKKGNYFISVTTLKNNFIKKITLL